MSTHRDNSARTITPEEHARISKHFINRLWNIFGEPKTNDLESFVDEYVRALSKYNAEQLIEGADELFRTLKKEFRVSHWPTIKECLDCCSVASKAIYARNNPTRAPMRDYEADDRRSLDERRAAEMIRGPVADRACRNGWIVGLYDFVRDNNRLPDNAEEDKLADGAAFVRQCAAGDVEMGFMHAGLFKLSQAMLERRGKLEMEFREGNA